DLASGLMVNLSSSDADEYAPVWSPDGGCIAYVTRQTRHWSVAVIEVDSGIRTTLADVPQGYYPVWVRFE
ncbi:MAG: PD40 domain-containing protein, partial [Anaerolineae bacterium]|nr:PD40 domain-containing protein [Anaerolineae bacterium]